MMNERIFRTNIGGQLILLLLLLFGFNAQGTAAPVLVTAHASPSTTTLAQPVDLVIDSPRGTGNKYTWAINGIVIAGAGAISDPVFQYNPRGTNVTGNITFTAQVEVPRNDGSGEYDVGSTIVSVDILEAAPNVQPITGDVELYPGVSTTLTVDAENDDGGDPTITWLVDSQENSTLLSAFSPATTIPNNVTFTAPDVVNSVTTYRVQARAVDSGNNSSFSENSAFIDIVVRPYADPEISAVVTNADPVDDKNPAPSEIITELWVDPDAPNPFYLVAYDYNDPDDSDVDPVSYSWSAVTGPAIDSSTAIVAVSLDSISGEVTYEYKVTITDDNGQPASKTIQVALKPFLPPTLVAASDTSITTFDKDEMLVGEEVNLSVDATDGDGAPTSFDYSWTVVDSSDAALVPNQSGMGSSFLFNVPDVAQEGETYTVTVTVDDGDAATDAAYTESKLVYIITVKDRDTMPTAAFAVSPGSGPYSEGTSIVLTNDGSSSGIEGTETCSNDGDQDYLDYDWEIVSASQVDELIPSTGDGTEYKFSARAVEDNQEITARLTVTNCRGNSHTTPLILVLSDDPDSNASPTAEAGNNQTIEVNSTYKLIGTGSTDPDGFADIEDGFYWEQLTGVTVSLDNENSQTPSFIAPSQETSMLFMLTVTDQGGKTSSDTVIINVSNTNTPPVAVAAYSPNDAVIAPDTTVVLISEDSSDAEDGDDVDTDWEYIQASGGPTVGVSRIFGEDSFTTPDDFTGSLEFELTVTDNDGAQDTASVFVNVGDSSLGAGPTAVANYENASTGAITEGNTVILDGSSSYDAGSGNIVSYDWKQTSGPTVPLGATSSVNNGEVSFVVPSVASTERMSFQLIVTDDSGFKDSAKLDLDIADNGVSQISADYLTAKPILDSSVQDQGQAVGFKVNSGGELVYLRGVPPTEYNGVSGAPNEWPFGMFDFRVKTDRVGGTAQVEIALSAPAADNAKYYKFDSSKKKFSVFEDDAGKSEDLLLDTDRRVITLTLRDGGPNDEDGVANGYIVDPSGLAINSGTVTTTTGGSSNVLGGGGSLGLLGLAGLVFVGRRRVLATRQKRVLH